MDTMFFVRGILIGFSIAAVVGPIGVLCIQRTFHRGFLYGLVTGMGAATADAIYGCIAGFGLTVIATFLVNQLGWIRLLGGAFLIYLGLRTLLSKPAERAAEVKKVSGFFGAYASTLLLTLTNPATIISFAAVFAGLGVGTVSAGGGNYLTALLVVLGVFLGSVLWWLILSGGVSLLHGRITPHWLLWVNRLSGGVITLFGVFALVSFI